MNAGFIWWQGYETDTIYHSQRAWLTGDLTNNNAESAFLSGKQIRQENRLISVDINLKNIVYWRLTADETKYVLMFISCFK